MAETPKTSPQTPKTPTSSQAGGATEPVKTTTPVTSSTTGAPTAPAAVKPADVVTGKTAAPQNVTPNQQSATPNQAEALKAAEAAQRQQNVNSGQPANEMPSDAAAKSATAAGADKVKEQTKVEAGQALASGATDIKQNRDDVTTPSMIPDHKKPNNDGVRPTMQANPGRGGAVSTAYQAPSVEEAPEAVKKAIAEKQLKDKDGNPYPAIPQAGHEIAASNPIKGASAPVTPANVQSDVAEALNTRVNVGTLPNTGVGKTEHNVVGATGPSGTPGTGDSGVTTGGNAPQNVTKEIVFTVLLADSDLKRMGFTHTVADNNSRQIVAAFASEADAVKYSDVINK